MELGSLLSLDSKVVAVREAGQRLLFYVPIIHSQEDMGTLGRLLPADHTQRQYAQVSWTEIGQRVRAMSLLWPTVKVYQDGLPDAAPEIVGKILAEVQSPNYDLLRWLVAQGAELIGTESPALMREEYEHLQAVLAAPNDESRAAARRAYMERAASLLDERDAFIARRIADSLPSVGIGLLFVGGAHNVMKHLQGDIVVLKVWPDEDTEWHHSARRDA